MKREPKFSPGSGSYSYSTVLKIFCFYGTYDYDDYDNDNDDYDDDDYDDDDYNDDDYDDDYG